MPMAEKSEKVNQHTTRDLCTTTVEENWLVKQGVVSLVNPITMICKDTVWVIVDELVWEWLLTTIAMERWLDVA